MWPVSSSVIEKIDELMVFDEVYAVQGRAARRTDAVVRQCRFRHRREPERVVPCPPCREIHRTFKSELPHPQAGDDLSGEKVWEWSISAMYKLACYEQTKADVGH